MSDQFVTGGFNVDFSDVPEREAIPAGEYLLEVCQAELKVSNGEKTRGITMLMLGFKVVGGEFDGRKGIFENLMLGGDARWKTKMFLKAAGLLKPGQSAVSGNAEEMIGIQVNAKVIQEVWAEEAGGDGSARNRVSRYMPVSEGSSVTVDDLFSGH